MEQDRKIYSLLQVTKSIQKTLTDRYRSSFWVKAEMNKLNHYSHSGHCYPELLEKNNGKVIAQINSILWKDDYLRSNKNFLDLLNEPLKDGIKILFLARVTFDPAHGLSLRIVDIDPSYTLGDLQREKQETISKLTHEGLYDRNKLLSFPKLPQRIAIISVETSKGYADFLSVLDHNQWNYRYFHLLFPSVLQGENAIESIIKQLRNVRRIQHHFDVVVIIRGGGGDVGLSCYNNYRLAEEIATFPLPVLTGIGHATNETVAELVAHRNAITPTKLADFLLQCFHNVAVPVQQAQQLIANKSREILAKKQLELTTEIKWFNAANEKLLLAHSHRLQSFSIRLQRSAGQVFANDSKLLAANNSKITHFSQLILANCWQKLANQQTILAKETTFLLQRFNQKLYADEKNVGNMSPENVMKRGYSITLHNGKPVYEAKDLLPGMEIETVLLNGSISSTVQAIVPRENNE